jgi:hypothetical protein
MTPGDLKFGFIGQGFGFGHWFVHSKGRCEWLVGDEPPPVLQAHDPDYHPTKTTDIEAMLDSKPVDVVVFLSQIPGYIHPVWSVTNTQTVTWISTKQLRKGTKLPIGVKTLPTDQLPRNRLHRLCRVWCQLITLGCTVMLPKVIWGRHLTLRFSRVQKGPTLKNENVGSLRGRHTARKRPILFISLRLLSYIVVEYSDSEYDV